MKMPTGKCRGMSVFFVLFVAILSCPGTLCAQEQVLEKVTIGTQPVLSSAGFFVAKEKGYFEEQGIDADLEILDLAVFPPLAAGKFDVGGVMLSAGVYNDISQRGGLKLVADKGHNLFTVVISKKLYDEKLNKINLAGQPFSVFRSGNPQEILTERFLKKYDLTLNNIQSIHKPFSEVASAFAHGSISGAVMIEPYLAAVLRGGVAVEVADSFTLYPGQQSSAVYYAEDFMVNRKETAIKFMAAYIKGLRYVNDYAKGKVDAKEFFEIMKKYVSVDDFELFRKMKPPELSPDGYLDLDSIKNDLNWYYQKGYIKKIPDLSDIVDNEFVEKALIKIHPVQ